MDGARQHPGPEQAAQAPGRCREAGSRSAAIRKWWPARPRRTALTGPDALTSAERRVAALAGDGLSNRQIAQHLFISQGTVETHLRHAFQKLGITSRASLPPLAHHIDAPAQMRS